MSSSHEPALITNPDLSGILDELAKYELIFHRPDPGTTPADLERMTSEDFWEVGASGRRYNRACVLAVLEMRRAESRDDVWETSDFHCRQLASDVYLLTYTLLQANTRKTRRSTVWRLSGGTWKMLYHQGTIVQDT